MALQVVELFQQAGHALAQLLPLLDYVDMDGAVLLAEDIAEGVRLDKGRCVYPDTPGNGVRLTKAGKEL